MLDNNYLMIYELAWYYFLCGHVKVSLGNEMHSCAGNCPTWPSQDVEAVVVSVSTCS